MKKPYTAILFLALTALLGATKYAGEIFQLSSGVQNQAMGNTGLTYGNSLAAGWWNPALLAEPGFSGVELMRVEHFEGLMQQNQLGAVFGTKTRTRSIIWASTRSSSPSWKTPRTASATPTAPRFGKPWVTTM